MNTPTAREMTRPDFPAVVHTYTDLLRLLRGAGALGVGSLAAATDRTASNIRRDLPKLVAAGVVTFNDDDAHHAVALTDKGRQWVAGRDVADGLVPAPTDPAAAHAAPQRWPIDKFRPNPANRAVDPATIPEMAQAIVAAGDVLHEITATPPDANGVRMILDGERRWRGARLLAEQTRLDGLAIALGLRFVERDATETEQLQIIIITATQRQDLSPLEDARLLHRYQELTGKSAADVARDMGRAGEGRSGLRDVQTKLKVAREATPEAIADYEANGSWDQLRNSVATPREPAPNRQLTAADFGVPADFRAHNRDRTPEQGRAAAAEWIEPGSLETFILPIPNGAEDFGYPWAQVQVARIRGSKGWLAQGGYSTGNFGHHVKLEGVFSGETHAYPSRIVALANAAAIIQDSLGRASKRGVPKGIATWIEHLLAGKIAPEPVETAPAPAADEIETLATPAPSDPWLSEGWSHHAHKTAPLNATGSGVNASLTIYRRPEPLRDTLYRCSAVIELSDGRTLESTRIPGCASLNGAIQLATEDLLHADRDAPRAVIEWLDAMSGEHVVGGKNCLNASRANERRIALGWVVRPSNSGGGGRPETEPSASTSSPSTLIAAIREASRASSIQTHEAIRRVLNERMRQIEAEGFDRASDDDQNGDGELAHAAAAYAGASAGDADAALWWPGGWDPKMFKPTGTIRDLERAGALIIAEIERRLRQGETA